MEKGIEPESFPQCVAAERPLNKALLAVVSHDFGKKIRLHGLEEHIKTSSATRKDGQP